MNKKQYEMWVVLSDIHAPYHDKKTLRTIKHFLKDQKPDTLVQIGDVVDCYSISKFDKDPERAHNLQWEFDTAHNILYALKECVGNIPFYVVHGNHEDRLPRHMKTSDLYGLRDLTIEKQLGLDELGIKYVKELIWKNTFMITHGTKTSKHSSAGEIDINGMSGMSGHVHRCQMFAKTTAAGTLVWYGIGHLCDIRKADYLKTGRGNWQQGIGVVYFHKKKKRFFATVVPITDHKLLYGGRYYTPQGVKNL